MWLFAKIFAGGLVTEPLPAGSDRSAAGGDGRTRRSGRLARQFGARLWQRVGADEVSTRAAALAYYFIFALFPALLFLTALLGLLPVPGLMERLLGYVTRVLPPESAALVRRTLGQTLAGASTSLLSLGALGALWAAAAGMVALIDALNVARGEPPLPPAGARVRVRGGGMAPYVVRPPRVRGPLRQLRRHLRLDRRSHRLDALVLPEQPELARRSRDQHAALGGPGRPRSGPAGLASHGPRLTGRAAPSQPDQVAPIVGAYGTVGGSARPAPGPGGRRRPFGRRRRAAPPAGDAGPRATLAPWGGPWTAAPAPAAGRITETERPPGRCGRGSGQRQPDREPAAGAEGALDRQARSEEHTSELQ